MNYIVYLNTKKLNKNDEQAILEYTKRLGAYCKTSYHLQPASKLSDLLAKIKNSEHSCLVSVVPGKDTPSSEVLASNINQIGLQGISTIYIFIGYENVTTTQELDLPSIHSLSLSSMDLSIGLTGVVLFEQIYRGYRILNNQPYHK